VSSVGCFTLYLTMRERRWLRRFHSASPGTDLPSREPSCPVPSNWGYHNAQVRVEDGPLTLFRAREDGPGFWFGRPEPAAYASDPRWPTHCACGYEFLPADRWQVHCRAIHRRASGVEMTTEEAPAGAMWDITHWAPERWHGPDGRSLVVKLPPGGPHEVWMIDGPSSDGGRWTRVGSTLPAISVTPSILTNKYHGWLREGTLVEC